MAIPVIAGSTKNSSATTTLTLTQPAGVVSGDLLLLLCGNDGAKSDEGFLAKTDWTLEFNYGDATADAYVALYSRIADGTEGATTDVPIASADDSWGFYFRVTGHDTTNPIRVIGTATIISAATGITIPAITTDTNTYSLAMSCFGFDGADADPFTESGTGWTYGQDIESPDPSQLGSNASGGYSTKEISTPSTSTLDSVITGDGTTDGFAATQFVIAGLEGGTPDQYASASVVRARTNTIVSEIHQYASSTLTRGRTTSIVTGLYQYTSASATRDRLDNILTETSFNQYTSASVTRARTTLIVSNVRQYASSTLTRGRTTSIVTDSYQYTSASATRARTTDIITETSFNQYTSASVTRARTNLIVSEIHQYGSASVLRGRTNSILTSVSYDISGTATRERTTDIVTSGDINASATLTRARATDIRTKISYKVSATLTRARNTDINIETLDYTSGTATRIREGAVQLSSLSYPGSAILIRERVADIATIPFEIGSGIAIRERVSSIHTSTGASDFNISATLTREVVSSCRTVWPRKYPCYEYNSNPMCLQVSPI